MNIPDKLLPALSGAMDAGTPLPPIPPKRHFKNEESASQCALIKWWDNVCGFYDLPEYALAAVPNGGLRSARTGARLKREGLRKGYPDLLMDVSRGGWKGLRIEMKAPKGVTSDEQDTILSFLMKQGYRTDVCYSTEDAQKTIIEYLNS